MVFVHTCCTHLSIALLIFCCRQPLGCNKTVQKCKSYPINSSICFIKQLFTGLSYFNDLFHLLQTLVTNNCLKIAVEA